MPLLNCPTAYILVKRDKAWSFVVDFKATAHDHVYVCENSATNALILPQQYALAICSFLAALDVDAKLLIT